MNGRALLMAVITGGSVWYRVDTRCLSSVMPAAGEVILEYSSIWTEEIARGIVAVSTLFYG